MSNKKTQEEITLPLLVTKDILVFPSGKDERLEIDRPFSKEAVIASRETGTSLIFVTNQDNVDVNIPNVKDIFGYATLCRIESFKDEAGHYQIRVSGTGRFKLSHIGMYENKYFVAKGLSLEDNEVFPSVSKHMIKAISDKFASDPNSWNDLPKTVVSSIIGQDYEASELSDILACYLPLDIKLRRKLLSTSKVHMRLKLLLDVLEENETKKEEEQTLEALDQLSKSTTVKDDDLNKQKIILPLLVTRELLVFPNRKDERLDVGRDFSIAAIDASRECDPPLLFVTNQSNEDLDSPTIADIFNVGTLCRIDSFANDKGYYQIRVSGLHRFKLTSIMWDEKNYLVAEGHPLKDTYGDENEIKSLVKKLTKKFASEPSIVDSIPRPIVSAITVGSYEAGEFSNVLASYLKMKTSYRRELLSEPNVNKRLKILLKVMDEAKLEKEIDQKIQQEVSSSAEKNQRDYILREKLKAIKHQLGEDGTGDSEESIKERLENNPYPEHVKKKALSELNRYNMMPQASLEASLIKSYIDLLLDVPWYQKTEDNDSLENVKKILDEDHYGLKNVKTRIVEYLAVKQMTGNLKAPILCFYGPPGCGKTSLGKSIARALGRKFFKASLGGISDEAEIRGHRRTYVGSMPGRIISGMKRCGVTNPVFLLDEIDKLASSYKGDPSSALLEVLDPEQNFAFNDNYLEEPYDLSNVLFIATANYLENVPAPLRDRLELIEVPSYTELEKIQIAKNFLVKKQLEANGLSEEQVTFKDEAIKCVIQHYTKEAGVRELERKLATIMRKICIKILTEPKTDKIVVGKKEVNEYLGIHLFENSKKENRQQVGVVTGLAYTEFGGDILPIEVNYFPGKSQLILTGKLGEVMKESASIALNYIRSNADKYGIDSDVFASNDIHVHVPEGAVPKDGPSAGVAITTAIVSCLTKQPVDNNVAMTGEVTLRGNALPIGGLREKSLAALRSGIKTIIVPRENKKNVDELPEEVKDSLNIVYMDNVDDAIKVAITHNG